MCENFIQICCFLKLNWVSNSDLMWAGLVVNNHSWKTDFKPTFISNYSISVFVSNERVLDDLCFRPSLLMRVFDEFSRKLQCRYTFYNLKEDNEFHLFRFKSGFEPIFLNDSLFIIHRQNHSWFVVDHSLKKSDNLRFSE